MLIQNTLASIILDHFYFFKHFKHVLSKLGPTDLTFPSYGNCLLSYIPDISPFSITTIQYLTEYLINKTDLFSLEY
jgi:hypothetical protein